MGHAGECTQWTPAASSTAYLAAAGIQLIVCITEGIPVHDMLMVKHYLARSYRHLNLPNLARTTASVLAYNYPKGKYLSDLGSSAKP